MNKSHYFDKYECEAKNNAMPFSRKNVA